MGLTPQWSCENARYHHAVIAALVWAWMEANWTLHWYGMMMNTIVHTFMYHYFAVTAADKNVRVWWKKVSGAVWATIARRDGT